MTLKVMDRTGHTTVEVADMAKFEEAIKDVPNPTFYDASTKEPIQKDTILTAEEVIVVPQFVGG